MCQIICSKTPSIEIMRNPQIHIPRNKKTLDFYLDTALPANLAHVFLQLAPGQTIHDFYRSVLIPMSAERVFGDELLKLVYEQEVGVSSHQILLIACGYLIEANVARKKGDRRGAWSCAMDAMYYCAGARNAGNYVNDLPAMLAQEIDQAISDSAVKSAGHRSGPYKEVGAEAVRIIKMRGEGGARWKYAKDAANEICEEMFLLAKSKGVPFYATDRGAKTITKYLTDAKELSAYFTEKKRGPSKNIDAETPTAR
jgi:hypothetical protein